VPSRRPGVARSRRVKGAPASQPAYWAGSAPLTRCDSPCGGRRDGTLSPTNRSRTAVPTILLACPSGEDIFSMFKKNKRRNFEHIGFHTPGQATTHHGATGAAVGEGCDRWKAGGSISDISWICRLTTRADRVHPLPYGSTLALLRRHPVVDAHRPGGDRPEPGAAGESYQDVVGSVPRCAGQELQKP
jgi:hypothetical protein